MASFELRMLSPDDPLAGDLPLLIRYAYVSDYAYEVEARETAAGFSWSLIKRPASPQISKEHRWLPFDGKFPRARGYVAFIDGEPVGYVEFFLDEFTNLVRVVHLYVRHGYRHMGVGSRMIGSVEQAARHFRARGVVLETQTCNVPAIEFFNRLGYSFWSVDTRFYSNDDIAKRDVRVDLGKEL
ncbi:MAG: GNAT family N-acetyltransferase [Fimbriimonadales bacterium]|nr:GNAT family N-acetyltransferase [Fimbriimonadales bacterium]